jgi:hypothetical protein
MQAEIGVGVGLWVSGDLGEPGRGDHDAGGGDGVTIKGLEAGGVFGVGDGEVVGVNDEKLGSGRIAEALGDGGDLSGEVESQRDEQEKMSAHRGLLGESGVA